MPSKARSPDWFFDRIAANPVGQGLVPNLAHPGGNLTGFTSFEFWPDVRAPVQWEFGGTVVCLAPNHAWSRPSIWLWPGSGDCTLRSRNQVCRIRSTVSCGYP